MMNLETQKKPGMSLAVKVGDYNSGVDTKCKRRRSHGPVQPAEHAHPELRGM